MLIVELEPVDYSRPNAGKPGHARALAIEAVPGRVAYCLPDYATTAWRTWTRERPLALCTSAANGGYLLVVLGRFDPLACRIDANQVYPCYEELQEFRQVAGANLIRADHGHSLPTEATPTLTASTFRGASAHGRAGWSQVRTAAITLCDCESLADPSAWLRVPGLGNAQVDGVQRRPPNGDVRALRPEGWGV